MAIENWGRVVPHGFSEDDWAGAIIEGRALMISAAKAKRLISYGELFGAVRSIALNPHDRTRVAAFLDEVSLAEDSDGRGLLSVVVVHKNGDRQPGPGFFSLARARGRAGSDEAIWINELRTVYDAWTN